MPPKKSSATPTLQPKAMVLAKMSRFPQWPAFIMPKELIPQTVLKVKKKVTSFCVIFIPDGDFYWMTDKLLEPLTRSKLDTILEKVPEHFKKDTKNKKKKKGLSTINEAFAAADGLDFDTFIKGIFKERGEAYDDEEEEVEEEVEDEEEEDEEEEETEEKPTVAEIKKRTNGRAPKQPIKKQKKDVQLTEEEKQRQVWLCRIKLQRSLIQRNQPVDDTRELPPPSDQELTTARLILFRLNGFPMSVSLLKSTKIHKVLKCILKDDSLAYNDSFKLHERCDELLSKWDLLIQNVKFEKLGSPANGNGYPKDTENKDEGISDISMEKKE